MAKTVAIAVDQGPPERRQHNKVVVERGANMKARLRIVDQTEIDRLLLERKINLDQHTSGEHLLRDILACGYVVTANWIMDSNIRGGEAQVSRTKADAILKIGLARAWLLAKAGRRTTEFLFGVVIGERKVEEPMIPSIRLGLNKYQSFESWWYDREIEPLPVLLADLPGDVKLLRPFHHEV